MTDTIEQWALIVGGLLTAIGGAQGLKALFRRRARRTRTDDAVALSAGTIRWAEKLEATADRATERATAAEAKADAAEATADEAQRHAVYIERQLNQVVSYLDVLLSAIFDQDESVSDADHMAHVRAVARRRPDLTPRSAS